MTATMAKASVVRMVQSAAAASRQTTPATSVPEVGALVLLAVVAVTASLFLVTATRGGTANDSWAGARRAPLQSVERPGTATVLLFVDSPEALTEGERHQVARQLGMRGDFEVQVVTIASPEVELALRSMLLSEQICPPGACNPILILDVR